MRSIRRILLFWLLGIVMLGIVLAGVLIYRQAQAEANALFDYQLQQTAAALPSEPFSSVLGNNAVSSDGVVIQIWSRDGAQLYYSHPRSPLAPRAELGFSTEHTPSGDWRVYSAIVGDNVVQLAQPMAVRSLLAAETAWRTVWPLVVLLPVMGIAVWLSVGRGLRPLSRLAKVLEARKPEAVDPLSERKLPPEIRPVVQALNGLLQRLNVAFDNQKAFVADAAHELRTPLAALRIQTQLLERADDDVSRREALADLKHGVERATRLLEQLLLLARSDMPTRGIDAAEQNAAVLPDSGALPALGTPSHPDLRVLAESCVGLLAPLAIDKGVDLGLAEAQSVRIIGDVDDWRVLIGNLLDNAVKYTPSGGRVDVSLGPGDEGAWLEIVDTGPGIADAEKTRVFDRFYRSPDAMQADNPMNPQGSGLGLAIVKRIADRYGATVTLADRAPNGLRVRLHIPTSA
ncbi:ATP-binding protein [Robbsia andropogonis]|uniref:ATP-binding protein n=1 Tax=Robbsia andropogonis TaxID=28092 RepID=UPI0004642293|nr:ATP-binding protein [Robbsia andropogonis]MCP1116575.1 ATP-binding protein [Robbsia andropogonis]MCP1126746.1 ATP-binding protein [Robbsia andropogonis]